MAALRGHRVVFVVAGEVLGGAERGALDLAEMMRDEGASVAVLALDDRPGRGRKVAAERRLRWVTEPVPWVGGRLHKSASLATFGILLACAGIAGIAGLAVFSRHQRRFAELV